MLRASTYSMAPTIWRSCRPISMVRMITSTSTMGVLPAMIRKISLAKALYEGDWSVIRRDLATRPMGSECGTGSEEEIVTRLEEYGIYRDRLVLWGTGAPLQGFSGVKTWLMPPYSSWSIALSPTCTGGNKEIHNCHINIGTGKGLYPWAGGTGSGGSGLSCEYATLR